MNKRLKQNKAISLVALIITIIVLIILAGVSFNIILGENGIVNKAKETVVIQDVVTAKEKLELLKGEVQLNEDYGYSVNLDNYLIALDKVKEKYKASDIHKINDINAQVLIDDKYKFLITDKENGDVEIIYLGEASGIILSQTRGTIIHPNKLTFEIIKNESGGKLSVESENDKIATASIEGTTVTVQSQGLSGVVKIIVRSEANEGYAAGKATFEVTVESGEIILDATPYIGIYDGKSHNAITNVEVKPADAKIEYALENGEYSTTVPKVTNADSYTVLIKASKEGYTTKEITKTVTVAKSSMATASALSKTYTGSAQTGVTGSNVDWSGTTSATNAGTYTAYATPKANYTWSDGTTTQKTITWEIKKAQGKVTLSETSGTISYDIGKTITITENISGGELSAVSSDETLATTQLISSNRLNINPVYSVGKSGTVTITVTSAATDNYEAATATVIVTVTGKITLEVTVATPTYSGNPIATITSVDVTPTDAKVEYALGDGAYSTTVPTVTDAGTYTVSIRASKEGYVTKEITKTVTVEKGIATIAFAPDRAVTYNGSEQTAFYGGNIDVTGTASATNVGTYTAYATPKANYTWSDGTTTQKTITWEIKKAQGKVTLSATSGTLTYPSTKTFTVTENVSGGALSVSSSNTSVATASIRGTTVTITPEAITSDGQKATITVTSAATANYKEATATYTVTVNRGEMRLEVTSYSGAYDGNAHDAITITFIGPLTAKKEYALDGGEYSTTVPTVREEGTYTVSIRASQAGYKTIEITKTVTIGNLILSETSGTVTYPSTKTFTVSKNVSGGTVFVNSNNPDVATASISGTTVTITPKAITSDEQKATILVQSAATSNYPAQKATYTVTVNRGTITLNATAASPIYTGSAQNAITSVSVTPRDAKVEYALGDGAYSTTVPTVTGAGTYTVSIRASKAGYVTNEITKTVTVAPKTAEVRLSATSGTTTYPSTKTFTVSHNTSGGTLSVSSSNTSVATASISGTTVTITPQVITADENQKEATITVKSAAKGNYKEAKATYTVTVKKGTITLNATAASPQYTGSAQKAITSVSVTPTDAKVEYALKKEGPFSTTVPTVTAAGNYTVYIKASKAGYVTKDITKTVTVAVAKVGSTKYGSVQDAINSISSSGTVTMISNSTESNVTVSDTKNITLDLNGKTLKAHVINEGTLTVEGEVSGSTINGNNKAAISNKEGATLNINSGNITSSAAGDGDLGATIHNIHGGTVTINGGIIEQTGDRNAIYNAGTTTITGGTIKRYTTDAATINSTSENNVESNLFIKGGTIYSNLGRAIIIKENTNVEISGGTIYSTGENFSTIRQENSSSGKLTITGGTIRSEGGRYAIYAYARVIIKGSPKIYSTSNYAAIKISSGTTSINGGKIFNGTTIDDPGSGKAIVVESEGYLNIGTADSTKSSDITIKNATPYKEGDYSGATIYIKEGRRMDFRYWYNSE